MSYTENEYKYINEKLHDEIYSLTKQIKIMRDALKFYAKANILRYSRFDITNEGRKVCHHLNEDGDRARQALAELEQGE